MQNYIKSFGYRVFIRPNGHGATYCFYTDGERIAYAQWGSINSGVSSVHKANRTSGTGFKVSDRIDRGTLEQALFCFAPEWATNSDRQSVVKYKHIQEYLDSSLWNSSLEEI